MLEASEQEGLFIACGVSRVHLFSTHMTVMSMVTLNWTSLWSGMETSPSTSRPASEVRAAQGRVGTA